MADKKQVVRIRLENADGTWRDVIRTEYDDGRIEDVDIATVPAFMAVTMEDGSNLAINLSGMSQKEIERLREDESYRRTVAKAQNQKKVN